MTKADTNAMLQKTWETRIADYQKSGQTAKQWCAANGITPRQLYYWRKKLLKETSLSSSPEKPVKWLPIKIKEPEPGFTEPEKTLTLKIGNCQLEIKENVSPVLLSEVLQVLINLC